MNRLTSDEYRMASKLPITVVLDNVRSMHNVGSVFRTADAFRIERLILCGITAGPENEQVHKTALGAEHTVDSEHVSSTLDAVKRLQAEGYKVYAIEQAHGSTPLDEVKLSHSGKYAVIFGHEVFGVQQEVVDAADGCIEIPQYGTKHSLNVSVTAGIVIYQLAKQLIGTDFAQ